MITDINQFRLLMIIAFIVYLFLLRFIIDYLIKKYGEKSKTRK